MWGWVRMKLPVTYGLAIAALLLVDGALPAHSLADQPSSPTLTPAVTPLAKLALPQAKPPVPAKTAKHRNGNDQLARHAPRPDRHRPADAGDADQKMVQVKAIGPCQLGRAAWYGGRYVGRRTSSGEPLDQIHATAAHRTLPLNTLVRVTNLNNGHSVVVRITDRGPVNTNLLIDMSPKAADMLAMKTDGIVPVSIEQVVEVTDAAK
jgi:rare lipoprotein A (peptidoglycan hydrolase)